MESVWEFDSYLAKFKDTILARHSHYKETKSAIIKTFGASDLYSMSDAHKKFGYFFDRERGTLRYREYCPGARAVYFYGEFNGYDKYSHRMKPVGYGQFEIEVNLNGFDAHNSEVRTLIVNSKGEHLEKMSPYSTYCTQKDRDHPYYISRVWAPRVPYRFKHPRPKAPEALLIYECHIGMSSESPKISTYSEFKGEVLEHIAASGYNAVQFMAIQEHPYYASFGYQVSHIYAPSSRFGNPDELKELIDRVHEKGLLAILDIVHSHTSPNVLDGITDFLGGDKHFLDLDRRTQWGSSMFDYSEPETLRYLLSNLRYWIEEFGFDGFRFDAVTAMLYKNQGVGEVFGEYSKYFGDNVSLPALTYLTLANDLVAEVGRRHRRKFWSIAEDVSGYPGLCRQTGVVGGVGFDYRLAMSLPDLWIKVLKTTARDEDLPLGEILYQMENRRRLEKVIAYCESHDQSLVGDKTLIFWLLDKEMYTGMTIFKPPSLVIDRGISLHKLIRLLTFGLGGEGYLNFCGNEFGHPEWVDFPCERNGYDFTYARRQWSLAYDGTLRYQHLWKFDKEMLSLEARFGFLSSGRGYVHREHLDDLVVSFERGGLYFAFNFHPSRSYRDFKVASRRHGKFRIVLSSDMVEYGGYGRVDVSAEHFTLEDNGRPALCLYLPARTALVLYPTEW